MRLKDVEPALLWLFSDAIRPIEEELLAAVAKSAREAGLKAYATFDHAQGELQLHIVEEGERSLTVFLEFSEIIAELRRSGKTPAAYSQLGTNITMRAEEEA